MAENKTQKTDTSVDLFLSTVEDKVQQEDSRIIIELMEEITKEKPTMWGASIIGFGSEHYEYKSGREGDMPKIGFSPRRGTLTLYVLRGGELLYSDLLLELGKYKTGKICLYIKRLLDVDLKILKQIILRAISK